MPLAPLLIRRGELVSGARGGVFFGCSWRLWRVVIALFSASGAGAETLTIATYNVENYVLADRITASGYRQAYPKPESQKHALRRVIRDLHADVLVVQEMGPQPFLDELQQDLRTGGVDFPFTALAVAGDADRHVAVLSRRRLRNVTTHRDLSFPYFGGRETVKRGLLEVTIETALGDVTLFAVHLKSRFTDRIDDPLSALRRAGEAAAIRDRILQRFPNPAEARFIILGDCNDSPRSRPLAALQNRGKTRIAELLAAADSRGDTWTHAYRREDSYSRADYMLVSAALKPQVRGGVAVIYDGAGAQAASDHRPVFLVLAEPAR